MIFTKGEGYVSTKEECESYCKYKGIVGSDFKELQGGGDKNTICRAYMYAEVAAVEHCMMPNCQLYSQPCKFLVPQADSHGEPEVYVAAGWLKRGPDGSRRRHAGPLLPYVRTRRVCKSPGAGLQRYIMQFDSHS